MIGRTYRDCVDRITHPPLSICSGKKGREGKSSVGNLCEYSLLEWNTSAESVFITSFCCIRWTRGDLDKSIGAGVG